MPKCSFCNKNIKIGTGKIYVRKDGRLYYFCSMKCEKNTIKLGRKPVKFKWTNQAKKVKKSNS